MRRSETAAERGGDNAHTLNNNTLYQTLIKGSVNGRPVHNNNWRALAKIFIRARVSWPRQDVCDATRSSLGEGEEEVLHDDDDGATPTL